MTPRTDKTIRIARFFSYPKIVVYVLVSLLLFVALVHWFRLALRLITRRRQPHSLDHGLRSRKPLLRRWPLAILDWLRATSMRRMIKLFWGAQVNWLEAALTVGYLTLLLAFLFAGTTSLEGQRVEPHYYANRAGTIAASQFPIMTALGMRNNPLSWLTGISFDKLNYLHRMTARVLVIMAWIHAGGRITVGLLDDETISHPWVRSGIAAASTLTVLVLVTFRPLRRKAYEWFMVVHFLLAGITLLALLKHLSGRSLTAYGAWPSLLLWGVDRALRGVQYLTYNYPYLVPGYNMARQSYDAEVEVLRVQKPYKQPGATFSSSNEDEDEDEPRFLRITLKRFHFHWRPGQSAYLAFPSVGLPSLPLAGQPSGATHAEGRSLYVPSVNPLKMHPFQSHPFTIMSYDCNAPSIGLPGAQWQLPSLLTFLSTQKSRKAVQADAETDADVSKRHSDLSSAERGSTEKASSLPLPSSTSSARGTTGAASPPHSATPQDLVFVVRVRAGMTRALWDLAAGSALPVAHPSHHSAARLTAAATPASADMGERASNDEADYHDGGSSPDYGGTGLKYTVPAFISGPYSNPPMLVGYHTVMLIAGGTGIAFTLPLFLDVIERARNGERSCEQLVFIWAARDTDHLKWIEASVIEALSTLPQDTLLKIRYLFCITGSNEYTIPAAVSGDASTVNATVDTQSHAEDDDEDPWIRIAKQQGLFAKQSERRTQLGTVKDEKNLAVDGVRNTSILQLPGASVMKSKPPIRELLQHELTQCHGRLSVNVCGTPSLSNSVREVLAQERVRDVMSHGPTVTLHVEAFGG